MSDDDLPAAALIPLEGGWSGETFLAEAAGERSVVRLYSGSRGPLAPAIDAAVLALARGLLPVPDVLEVRHGDAAAGRPGLLVTEYVDGERGDLMLATLDDAGLAALGALVGDAAAALAGVAMLRPGAFGDAQLTVVPHAAPYDADGLPEIVDRAAPRLTRLDADELAGLSEVALHAQELLDTVERTSLVHGDLNPKNVLIRRTDTGLELAAVLDWEFAHAGHPYTDLGNLLRFERAAPYVDAVLDAYAARHEVEHSDALALARAADLVALVDLATRPEANPVTARATDLLRRIARTRDLGSP